VNKIVSCKNMKVGIKKMMKIQDVVVAAAVIVVLKNAE
jgi:hypothetical protein